MPTEHDDTKPAPWWRGTRGEAYVVVQVLLFALVILGPKSLPGLPAWAPPWSTIASVLGVALIVAGGILASLGVLRLGPDLTPLPYPKDCAHLVQTGPYAVVRHPIYSGLIGMAFGYALFSHGWLTLLYAAILFAFFDIKSRREERWLVERYPDYPAYRARVHKLIPWLY